MPRWVKVFIVIGVILAVGFTVSLFAGVDHGPQRHGPQIPAQRPPTPDHAP